MNKQMLILGLMSGTSLDGLDIAACSFDFNNGQWHYRLHAAETIAYDQYWLKLLSELHLKPAEGILEADHRYGRYLGEQVNAFLKRHQLKADLVASHGHTLFHQPMKGFTYQIGHGADLHAVTGLPVVSDFRSLDVALGGQGAPLVPIGDALLFSGYAACLNLGGFSNISFQENDRRIAMDLSPCNILLNRLAQEAGRPFDANGEMASAGKAEAELGVQLNQLPFYQLRGPKSLGREWFECEVWPIFEKSRLASADKQATACRHIAEQIGNALNAIGTGKVLVTGGGAFHQHLMTLISQQTHMELVLPEAKLINYKEALVFAFLGWLRMNNQVNALKTVTGASADSSGGNLIGKI